MSPLADNMNAKSPLGTINDKHVTLLSSFGSGRRLERVIVCKVDAFQAPKGYLSARFQPHVRRLERKSYLLFGRNTDGDSVFAAYAEIWRWRRLTHPRARRGWFSGRVDDYLDVSGIEVTIMTTLHP